MTAVELQQLDREELHRLARESAGLTVRSRLILGRCLLAIQRSQSYYERGACSVYHFALLELQIPQREAYQSILVARRLEVLPGLTQAALTGKVSWSALEIIISRATPDNESTWLEMAQTLTIKRLARLARQAAEAEGEAEKVELKVQLSPEEMAMLQQVLRDLSSQVGRRLSMRECLECLCCERLFGSPFPEENEKQRLREEVRRDVAAQKEPIQAPWAAAAAEEEDCPGQPDVQLVKAIPRKEWENGRLSFNPQSRQVTPAQRQEILRRDGYQCAVPDCPHILWLHIHHVVYWSDGGVTVPENLLTVCGKCHRLIHAGVIRVSQDDGRGLIWTDREGRELARKIYEEPADWWAADELDGGPWIEDEGNDPDLLESSRDRPGARTRGQTNPCLSGFLAWR